MANNFPGIPQIPGLRGELDGKAATSHTHVISEVAGLPTAIDALQDAIDDVTAAIDGGEPSSTYEQSTIDGGEPS